MIEGTIAIFAFILGYGMGRLMKDSTTSEVHQCNHEWDKWKGYAIQWQRRKCEKCGIIEEREIN